MRLPWRKEPPSGPAGSDVLDGVLPLARLEVIADSAVDLAQQIRRTVAELRRQDSRGEGDDPA